MGKPKKTFIFYNDRKDYVDQMTREEAGIFLKAILSYQNGDPPDLDGGIKFIRGRIKKQLDEDNQKREEEVEKRRKAGRKGGLARVSNAKQNQASDGNSKQVLEKNEKFKQVQADNDNVNDNENKNENINNNTSITEAKASDKKKGNEEINKLIEIVKTANSGICDGTIKEQRQYGKNLLNKIKKIDKVQNGIYSRDTYLIGLLKVISSNQYHRHKIAGPKKIFYALAELIQVANQSIEKNNDFSPIKTI